jgi:hypothetical protein
MVIQYCMTISNCICKNKLMRIIILFLIEYKIIISMLQRTKCIICDGNYEYVYTIKNAPDSFCPKSSAYELDNLIDLNFSGCVQCGSVQLTNLIDPIILYEGSHNMTFLTPTWKEHHEKFSQFIINDFESNHITEVGGGNGILAKLIIEKINSIKYTILDLCNMLISDSNVEYQQGNCEDYQFQENDCVVMSHLFEHLYQPMVLIKNLRNCNVKKVYISIPNMSKQFELKHLSILHIEHTYLLDEIDTDWMFSQFGYKLVKREFFKNHSIFMEYEFSSNSLPQQLLIRPERINIVKEHFVNREENLSKIIIPDNSFIVPGGHYGQLIYLYSKHDNVNILGFLDNDKSKQGLRMYGTPLYTYPISELSKYQNQEINVLLHGGPYTNEIKKNILSYNDTVNIIEI